MQTRDVSDDAHITTEHDTAGKGRGETRYQWVFKRHGSREKIKVHNLGIRSRETEIQFSQKKKKREREKEIPPFAATRIESEGKLLSEMSQRKGKIWSHLAYTENFTTNKEP